MALNWIVALSNYPAIYAIQTTTKNKDWLTAVSICFLSIFSFASHLVENHKHGMPGIGYTTTVSYVLNRMDVLGVLLVGVKLGSLYYRKYGFNNRKLLTDYHFFLYLPLAVTLLQISEYDKYNTLLKNRYVITHSLWHVSIFNLMNYFLLNYIY